MSDWRLATVAVVLGAALAGLAARAVWLVDDASAYLQTEGVKRAVRGESSHAFRGVIYDRRGTPLAVSAPIWSVWADPQRLRPRASDIDALATALHVNRTRLQARLRKYRAREFAWLSRHVGPDTAAAVRALGLSGVYIDKEYRRYYPAGALAAHIVGIADIDEQGREGVERAFDAVLAGTPGRRRLLRDRHGRAVRELEVLADVEHGQDVYLALDMRLQHLAFRELDAVVRQSRARSASMVMLDVRTGEILALANQPSYNPNRISERTDEALRNRAVVDSFEPGSTAKPFSMVAALESGLYRADSRVDTRPGYLRVGNKLIEDPTNRGVLSLPEILAKSSQVGITRIALTLPPRAIVDVLQRVGVGSPPGTGLPGEAAGMLPAGELHEIERATLAYGYGFMVSPIQLARAYLVLAAGGRDMPVSVLRVDRPPEAPRVIDAGIARQVVEMLARVVEPGGTAPAARIPGYRVAGKTGTARKLGPDGYDESRHVAFFAGIAPLEDPRLVVVVVVDEPRGAATGGGAVAAPVFARVTSRALRLLRVPARASVAVAAPSTGDRA